MDKNLSQQQNPSQFAVMIFVLRGKNNKLETLQQPIPQILEKIADGVTNGIFEIRK